MYIYIYRDGLKRVQLGGGNDRFDQLGPSWSFMTNLVTHDQLGHLRPTWSFKTNLFILDQLVKVLEHWSVRSLVHWCVGVMGN